MRVSTARPTARSRSITFLVDALFRYLTSYWFSGWLPIPVSQLFASSTFHNNEEPSQQSSEARA